MHLPPFPPFFAMTVWDVLFPSAYVVSRWLSAGIGGKRAFIEKDIIVDNLSLG
jgi:hypothetical protein